MNSKILKLILATFGSVFGTRTKINISIPSTYYEYEVTQFLDLSTDS